MKKNRLLDKIFLTIVSIQTILLGLLFIIQILRIYFGNNGTFTREICSIYLKEILVVIILWIVIIAGSYIYFKLNKHKTNENAKSLNISKLKTFEQICPIYQNEILKEEYNSLIKESNKRKLATIINIVIVIICSIMGFGYMVNVKHFDPTGNLMEQAIQMSVHLMPWVIISLISLIIRSFYVEISARKSINIIKEIIKSEGKAINKYQVNKKEELILLISRLSILTIAIVFIIVGITNGGPDSVLEKAINICTECIGLG